MSCHVTWSVTKFWNQNDLSPGKFSTVNGLQYCYGAARAFMWGQWQPTETCLFGEVNGTRDANKLCPTVKMRALVFTHRGWLLNMINVKYSLWRMVNYFVSDIGGGWQLAPLCYTVCDEYYARGGLPAPSLHAEIEESNRREFGRHPVIWRDIWWYLRLMKPSCLCWDVLISLIYRQQLSLLCIHHQHTLWQVRGGVTLQQNPSPPARKPNAPLPHSRDNWTIIHLSCPCM